VKYFEDLVVGSTARFGNYEVTREEVTAFATAYDPQAFHLSDEEAAKTHFERQSASGWHTAAMTMRMLVDFMDSDEPQASLGASGIDELRWLRPVYPGDTLSCETEILSKALWPGRPEMGGFRSLMTVRNQHGHKVLSFIANPLIATRAVAS